MAALASLFFRYSSILVQFVLVAFVTHRMDKEQAGWYFMLLGLILSTYFLFGFGIPDGLVCRLCNDREATIGKMAALVRDGYWRSLWLSAPALLVGACVGWLTCGPELSLASVVWWLAYASLFYCSQCMVATGRKAEGAFFFYSAASLSTGIVVLPFLWFASEPQLLDLVLATLVGIVPCALIAIARLLLRFHGQRPDSPVPFDPAILQTGLPICLSRVVQTMLYWLPVWVVGFRLSPGEAGDFAVASRLAIAANAFIAAIRFIVRPQLAGAADEDRKQSIEALSRVVATLASVFVLCVLVGNVLVGEAVIRMVFGSEYSAAAFLFSCLLVGTLGECVGGPVDEVLKMSGYQRFVLKATVVALLFEAVACSVAVQVGALGVAVSQALTLWLLFGWLAMRTFQELKIFVGLHLLPSTFFASLGRLKPETTV